MKYFVTALVLVLSTSAFAKHVPVPPKRPAELTAPAPIFNTDPNVYGAIVKNGQVIVKAPLGSDVQVDVDGTNVDVSVEGNRPFWHKLLPWKW